MLKPVLVHGLPDSSGVWGKVESALARAGVKPCTVDLPGLSLGDSLSDQARFSEIAKALQERLPEGPLLYIGHDFGGILGTMLAAASSSTIQRLILVNAATPEILQSQIKNDPDQSQRSAYARKIVQNPRAVLSARDFLFLKAFLFKPENSVSSEYSESILRLWRETSVQDAIGTYYRSFFELEAKPLRFDQPCLQIWSTQDPFLGPGVRSSMLQSFPRHEVAFIPTESHWPQLAAPDAVASHILNELRK